MRSHKTHCVLRRYIDNNWDRSTRMTHTDALAEAKRWRRLWVDPVGEVAIVVKAESAEALLLLMGAKRPSYLLTTYTSDYLGGNNVR